ncbi:MAG: hypothetical protein NTX50_17220 [Candidatus Sumerlaeota bacterium]|nr:hypothetical protein [Candidatus Sumerlaeota bacterium]
MISLRIAIIFLASVAMSPGAEVTTASASKPAAASRIPPTLKEVIIVTKTHLDIGYTDLIERVLTRYRTSMVDVALKNCEEARALPPEQRFVWTLPGWAGTQILWPGQTPERREGILRAFREGRFVTHALPFTMHSESLEVEEITRGLRYASDLARMLGQPLPHDAKMTDVPSHSWILPVILRHSGVTFLHIGCNGASSSPEVPDLFWWEGPDGSRLLTMYTAKSYGADLIPPKDWPHQTWLALMHTGDNHGPYNSAEVKKILDRAARELPGVKVRFGRLSDFGDAILKENPNLPVVRGDMPDTWIHGLMSMPDSTGLARQTRPQLLALDALDTQMRIWGLQTSPLKDALAKAYDGSLLYGEHTWGKNSGSVGHRFGAEWKQKLAQGYYKEFLKSFDDHRNWIRSAAAISEPELDARMKALARGVKVSGARVVVYNPLPWRRDAVARVKWPAASNAPAALKDVENGSATATAREGEMLVFLARDLPPMGYRSYVAMDIGAAKDASKTAGVLICDDAAQTIENDFLKVTLDAKRGGARSVVDKKSGCELVDPKSAYVLGQYLYERFDESNVKAFVDAYAKIKVDWAFNDFGKKGMPDVDTYRYQAASPKDFDLKFETNEVFIAAVFTSKAGAGVPDATETRIVLYRNQPFLDVEWRMPSKTPDPLPEGGWLCLPLNIPAPQFRLGRLGGIMDPAKDVVRGANRNIFCLNSGMTALGEDGRGVGLCALDSPLVSIETPGLWKYSKDFIPKRADVFVNLYNNMWSTNFPLWIGGELKSRVRVWAASSKASSSSDRSDQSDPSDASDGLAQSKGSGAANLASLITPSWEARMPCLAAAFEGEAGALPPAKSGIGLSRKGALVTAFGANPDGEGTLLRVWEHAGLGGPCRIQLPKGVNASSAQPCDLRGQSSGEPIPIRDGALDIPLGPFAPYSVVLKP